MDNGLPNKQRFKVVIGRIKILETSKMVGVVEVTESKKNLKLEESVTITVNNNLRNRKYFSGFS